MSLPEPTFLDGWFYAMDYMVVCFDDYGYLELYPAHRADNQASDSLGMVEPATLSSADKNLEEFNLVRITDWFEDAEGVYTAIVDND